MSNFIGITFAEQKVTPSDDAILRRMILDDGILYGCDLAFAGFTLTMGAGHLLLAGREIQHTASENWAVSGAASGFARLVITIDLSKTSTKDIFDQIETTIEYASNENGFPELEQSEINVTGVKYQAEFCVVALSAGGITGIVRHMPGAALRGGADTLKTMLAAGYMQLSAYQIMEELPDPATVPEGTMIVVPIQQVT